MTRIEEYRSSSIFENLKPLSKRISPSPFSTYVWENYYDNDFIYEFARISHSFPVTRYPSQDYINKAVYTCKRVNDNKSDSDLECVLTLTLGPWHYLWKKYNEYYADDPSLGDNVPLQPEDITTIYTVPTFYTDYIGMTVHDGEIAYLVNGIEDLKTKIDNSNTLYGCNIRIGKVELDCEQWSTRVFDTEANYNGIKDKMDTAQIRIMSALAGITDPNDYISEIDDIDLTWYIKGGHFSSYGDKTDFSTFYTGDADYHTTEEIQTIGCASIYTAHNEISVNRYLEAIEVNVLDANTHPELYHDRVAVYFSLCMGYNPINQYSQEDIRFYSYIDNPVIYSYKMGRKMAGENSISVPINMLHLYPAPYSPSNAIAENYDKEWNPGVWDQYIPSTDFTQTGDTPYPTDLSAGAQTDFVDHWIEFVKGFNDVDDGTGVIYDGEIVEVDTEKIYRFYFKNASDEATITVGENNYIIGISVENSQFIWDKNGGSHTFTEEGEVFTFQDGVYSVSITYHGEGSHLFSVSYSESIYETWYKTIADTINSSQDRGSDVVSNVDQMAIDINNSEMPTEDTNKKKLENRINTTSNLLNFKNVLYTNQVLVFVKNLQKYMTAKYGSVNIFLRNNNIKVKSIFADISATVGYIIDSENIEDDYSSWDFFVSSYGSDSNDGLTPLTAWKSLDKVSAAISSGDIEAGNVVGFKTDDTFVGTLDTNAVSGSLGSPITFTSYGTGDKPIFSGLVSLEDSWVDQGGNIWRYDVSALPSSKIRYLLLNNVNQQMAQSEVGYCDSATKSYFIDYDLSNNPSFNPSVSDYEDGDFVGAEVLMRNVSYMWQIRTVSGFDSSLGRVVFTPDANATLGVSSGSVGGYFFQNSLFILQQNSIQNEWVNEGNYIYFYSTVNPYTLGTIQISSIDTLLSIEDSDYLVINNIKFDYANYFAIHGGNSNYKKITECDFERCCVGIFETDKSSTDSIIDNNTFLDMGSVAISQYYPVNITVSNNTITNTGLEIGRIAYYFYASASVWHTAIHCNFANSGLFKYNNIINTGYIGFNISNPSNNVLVQYNYVENPCLILVDGGAYYSYSETQPLVTSNINQITYKNNIGIFNDNDNEDYLIGYEGSGYGWLVNGLYKDGLLRASNYYDNFAAGFSKSLMINPAKHCDFERNICINNYYKTESSVVFLSNLTYSLPLGQQDCENNVLENNTFISVNSTYSYVGGFYDAQLNSGSSNAFDYNKFLKPMFSSPGDIIFSINTPYDYLTLVEWKAYDNVGDHETTNLFTYSMSGLSDEEDFIWYATNPTKETVNVSFEAGYRYYTVDGDEVTSDTLTLYQGKVYYRTIDEGMPQATNVTILEDEDNPSVGSLFTASYTYSHEEGNSESGSTYQWYRSVDGTVEARVTISGANDLTYVRTEDDYDQYILFGVIPKSSVGAGSLVTGVERFSNLIYVDIDFYVSSLGDDSNDGRTADTSWQSLAKVSEAITDGTIVSGDRVGFKTDDTFVGTLNTNAVSGSLGSPITFTSYGTGDKPIISGLVSLEDNWDDQGSNIWRYDVSALPASSIRYLLLGGVEQQMAQSEVRFIGDNPSADYATVDYFEDLNLGGSDGDYVDAEVLMRTNNYNWEIREVSDYDADTGRVTFISRSRYALGTSFGSDGGYFFQNSLFILQQNTTQSEWAQDGNYLYFYSTVNPYTLGTIQVSSIDTFVDLENSDYITIDNLRFDYSNSYAIFNENSNYNNITNCYFDRCNVGIFGGDSYVNGITIDNNIFANIGVQAIWQYYCTDIAVTNNTLTNVGIEIGKMLVNLNLSASTYMAMTISYAHNGLIEYNNINNCGYNGISTSLITGHMIIRNNFVRNSNLLLIEGGSFYCWDYPADPSSLSSDSDIITYSNNIAIFDAYDNEDYLIGKDINTIRSFNGFHKDGYAGGINYDSNFTYGCYRGFSANNATYCDYQNNIAVDTYYSTSSRTVGSTTTYGEVGDVSRNNYINNTFITHNNTSLGRVILFYGQGDQLDVAEDNNFDYNKLLQPYAGEGGTIVQVYYPVPGYLTLEQWKDYPTVGIHETSDLFTFSLSGLDNPSNGYSEEDFIWYTTNPTKETVSVSFESGYRYYTVDGDAVISDTLTLYQGKVYYRTIDEGMPQATNVAILEDEANPSVGSLFTASYTYSHEEGNSESGSTYQWYRSVDGTIEARVAISGETNLTYVRTEDDYDQYVLFGVIPKSSVGAGSLITGVERFSNLIYIDIDFYVSSLGNDINDGFTEDTPWATLDKVTESIADGTIVTGDRVGFKSGDTFVGTLDTNAVSGSLGSPITFTSYGTGDKPIFSGLVSLEDSWVDQGDNVWRYDVSALPASKIRYLLLNNINQQMAQSEVRFIGDNPSANYATVDYFEDLNLGGNDGDYVNAEVLMRTTAYTWENRNVTQYDSTVGRVTFNASTDGILGDTVGYAGGYFFQNSLFILQQNSVQNEWVNEGNYIYYYSTVDPYTLGTIQVSSIDMLLSIEDSDYLVINNIKFDYANYFAIYGGNSNYKEITECDFERCGNGIYEYNSSSTDSVIDDNTFSDIGSIGIHQYQPVDITITNNTMTNIGVEIGRVAYISNYVYLNMWYSAISIHEGSGGIFKYNNIENVGYAGFKMHYMTNHALVQYNYVKNNGLLLVDVAAYYVYSDYDYGTTSNINKITFQNNICIFDAYDNEDYLIGYEGTNSLWLTNGFGKDGFIRAVNYYDNFSFGFDNSFTSAPTMYSEWKRNVGINKFYETVSVAETGRAFILADIGLVLFENNSFENNVMISNYTNGSRVGLLNNPQLLSGSGNTFDYNKILEPLSTNDNLFYILGSAEYLDIAGWKDKQAVGIHETTDMLYHSLSGLNNPSTGHGIEDFIWYATNPTKETVNVSFEVGYRYYTVDGDAVTSDTLTLYQGKVYYRTIDEGMPQATSVTITNDTDPSNPSIGDNYIATYDYSHEEGNVESGSTYQWYRSVDGTVEARVAIAGETNLTYETSIEDEYQYILFGVAPVSDVGTGSLVTGVERFSNLIYSIGVI